jgi:hypothetical protein
MQKENVEKIIAIKQKLDQLLADKEAEIEVLKKLSEQVSELVTGVSFISAADIVPGALPSYPPAARESKSDGEEIKSQERVPTEESSAQWEKYIYDDQANLLAKLVLYASTATIIISHPEELQMQKDSPLFQEFFIEKFLLRLKEQSPDLTLDFEETSSGFLRQITISHVDSDENFAKIEQAMEHIIKKTLRETA